jgi:type IV pilus assembly protein PilV
MIEVLVSLVIAVIGLLGLVGIQAFTHQSELESYQRAQALILLNDVAERINSNRASAGCYAFTDAASGEPFLGTTIGNHLGTPNCASGFLNTQTRLLANSDMIEWNAALQGAAEKDSAGASLGAMAGARGCVSFDAATNIYTVVVVWQGMTETFEPVVKCGTTHYGPETRRRAVWTTIRIATLS